MTSSRGFLCISLFCAALPGFSPLWAQTAEVISKDAQLTFKSGTNLVPVTVVVRDGQGHAVGDLGVDDFQLFDNGKLQMISKFTVEKLAGSASPATQPLQKTAVADADPGSQTPPEGAPDVIPDRFVAYLFDDLHMSFSDLVYTREAARRQIDSSQHAEDRVAIFTTSGRPMQEFTADPDKLHAALAAIGTGLAESAKAGSQSMCPPLSFYMGDLIYNQNDPGAMALAVADAIVCANLDPSQPSTITSARMLAQSSATAAVQTGERDTQSALETLRSLVARMASMPGQRSVVLISPGFLVTQNRLDDETLLIERAIRANVVIGALDARGLFTMNAAGDASERVINPMLLSQKYRYKTEEAAAQSDVMANLASGTGGTFYSGTNDFDQGFALTAAPPEYAYVLGFSPLDLKLDGKFHSLKVVLKAKKGLSLQARKGYYAPKHAADPAEEAKQQMEDAFFSRDEMRDLPATLQTRYFKTDNGDATLSAVAKIDVKKLPFHKDGDRNRNDVTVMTGLFDSDGNYVSGFRKVVEMRLLDATLNRVGGGIAVNSTFTVHPGRYLVRMVVRDTEGQLMASQSSMVEIP